MEDFAEDLKEEEEALDEEEDEVTDQYSVTIVGYLGTIREIALTCNAHVHIAWKSITRSKTAHS